MFLRQLAERQVGIDAVCLRDRSDGFLHQLAIPARPGCDCATKQRLRVVGNDEPRIEIVSRAQTLTVGTRPVRRVEREGAWGHLRHRDAAYHAGQFAREQLVAAFEGVDDDDLVRKRQGGFERFRQPPLDARLDDQAIDDDVDVVVASPIELDVVVQGTELAVDAGLAEATLPQRLQFLLELALATADHRRQHVDARVGRIEHHQIEDALERLRGDLAAAVVAVRRADVGKEQTQVVVDLGDRADGRAWIRAGGLLLDRDGRREPFDQIDVGLLHLLEKLARIGGQRLDVATLPFRVDRVEGERGLA
jgi:hypothetical protein